MSTAATEYCRTLLDKEDHERYLMTLFAPASKRNHLWALYAFNLELAKTREQVSEPMLGQMRLQWWQEAVEALSNGQVRDNPVCKALSEIPSEGRERLFCDLSGLVSARAIDLEDRPFSDTASMTDYAMNTSGRLHQIALGIIDPAPTVDAHQAVGHTGTAWALVGLVRALGFQLGMNRLALPEHVLREEGLDPNALFQGPIGDEIWPVVERLTHLAETELEAASRLAGATGASARPLIALNRITIRYLKRLERREDSPFSLAQDSSDLPNLWQFLLGNLTGRFRVASLKEKPTKRRA